MSDRPAPAAPRPPAFSLVIEEMVIEGFAPAESRAIAAALTGELARLLHAPPAAAPFTADAHVDRLRAAMAPVPATPGSIGRAAARAVMRSLQSAATGSDRAPGGVDA